MNKLIELLEQLGEVQFNKAPEQITNEIVMCLKEHPLFAKVDKITIVDKPTSEDMNTYMLTSGGTSDNISGEIFLYDVRVSTKDGITPDVYCRFSRTAPDPDAGMVFYLANELNEAQERIVQVRCKIIPQKYLGQVNEYMNDKTNRRCSIPSEEELETFLESIGFGL